MVFKHIELEKLSAVLKMAAMKTEFFTYTVVIILLSVKVAGK